MTKDMSASWRKLVGIALLWVALVAVFRMSQGGGADVNVWVPILGFICFVAGLLLFADGLKRSIVAELSSSQT